VIRYIENIDIMFLISIYRIIEKDIEFFDISRYFTPEVYILLLYYQNNESKRRKRQTN